MAGSENSLELLVKIAGQDEFNALIDKIKAGTASIDDLARASKIATGVYRSWGKENDALKKGLADTIVTIKDMKDKAMEPLASANAKMMKSYFQTGEEIRRTYGSFISLNQIIQDAPFGMRGMGNNIQMLTQQFATLKAQGMSTGEILRGLAQNVLSPMGLLMFAVSAGTSALTVLFDYLGGSAKKAADQTQELVDKLVDMKVELGIITDAKYIAYLNENLQKLRTETEKGLTPTTNYFDQIKAFGAWLVNNPIAKGIYALAYYGVFKPVQLAVSGYKSLAGLITGSSGTLTGQFDEEEFKRMQELEQKELDLQKKIADFNKKRADEQERLRKKTPLRDASTGMYDLGVKGESTSIEQHQKAMTQYQKWLVGLDADTQRAITESQQAEWDRREHISEVAFQRQKEALQMLERTYNMVLFDPLRAGFKDLEDQIFGAQQHVEALQQAFGRTGAAIVRALEGVIMNLIETAMLSALLNAILPGSGTFASNFLRLSGISGGGGSSPITDAGSQSDLVPSILHKSANSATSIGIAAATRSRVNSQQNVVLSGVFVQRGSDLVAVVESSKMQRNSRSMSIGG